MKVLSSKLFRYIALASFSILGLFAVVPGTNVFAGHHNGYSGNIYGRGSFHGYYTNAVSDYYGDSVLRDYPGDYRALPPSINTVSEFINRLQNLNNNANSWDKRGSGFIVCTMLGHNGGTCGPTVTNAQWTDLTNRLNRAQAAGRINWGATVSKCINSMWDSDINDVVFYQNSGSCKNDPGIRIVNANGSDYELYRECANPAGTPTEIDDDPQWSITPSTSMSVAHPRPGDTTTWNHNAYNNGPDNTDKVITKYRQRSVNGGAWSNVNNWNHASNWNNGTYFGVHSGTWTPGQGSNGTTVCERTVVDPRAWNNNGSLGSAPDCATAWQRWQVAASTAMTNTGVSPGQTITWTHTLTNNGGDWTSAAVGWNVNHTPAAPNTETPNTSGSIGVNWRDGAANRRTFTNTYTIQSTDAGRTLCQGISASPSQRLTWDASPSGTVTSGSGCLYIPYNYQLDPNITTNPTTPSEVGASITVNPSVRNTGPTQSEPVSWQVHQLVYTAGTVPGPAENNSSSTACTYYTSEASCALISSGTRTYAVGNPSAPAMASIARTIPGLQPGDRVCYSLSIQPWRNQPGIPGGSDWRHSDLACITVAKKPKLHIEGGDLTTRGDIITSTSRISGRTYGSWVEYGILSTGPNTLAASGGGLRNGNTSSLSSDWSKLTFANTPTLGSFTLGSFASPHAYFSALQPTQTGSSPLTLPSTAGTRIIDAGTDVTINTSTIPVGGTVIVKATGTVTLTGTGIRYDRTGPITDIEDIPQVVIVANNIEIASTVTRVDAWLLAANQIQTCRNNPTGPLTASDCPNALIVNGPVAANTLSARRTAGATAAGPATPAERFIMSADSYLWAHGFTGGDQAVGTTYVTEIAPRF